MNILAINFNHDGSAAIISDGQLIAYVNTERFSRLKKHPGLREEDLVNLLTQAKISIKDIDMVFALLMESHEIVEKYGTDFKETWFKFEFTQNDKKIRIMGEDIDCIINPDHFLCHSAPAYYFSPFDSAICLAYDPFGMGAYACRKNRIEKINFPENMIGLIYNLVSHRIGLGGLFGAGKTMGLAPYGKHEKKEIEDSLKRISIMGINKNAVGGVLNHVMEISENGAIYIEEDGKKWNAGAAYNVQRLLEITLTDILEILYRLCLMHNIEPNLCLSGGTALNSVANERCFKTSKFDKLYLHPACGDDGTSIGAGLYYWHHVLGNPKTKRTNKEAMYSIKTYDDQIETTLEKYKGKITIRKTQNYIRETAELIDGGKIIGWYQGASEIGPRALGNRSILCDARGPEMKKTLNSRVKLREMFRPFAPSILNEYSEEWFGLKDSPFMLRVADVLKKGAPAITHVDGTARPQTVAKEDNPRYYELIDEFRKITGIPLVLNTSFNLKGEPIVETPEDATATFLESGMDNLVFPGMIISKNPSPL